MKKLLKEWQSRLGLNDWVIDVNDDVSPNDMKLQNVAGECTWCIVNKSAVIDILAEKDYGERIIPYDKEIVLVHELLHCKFAMIADSGNEIVDRYMHQLIQDLAKALVNAKRSNIK